MNIIKKTYSKNNNEIKLIECGEFCSAEQNSPQNQKTVLIIGVVHGDEPQGKFLIENYIKSICHCEECSKAAQRSNPKNRLFFIPCLNPDGLALKTRQNINRIDINRNFPTKNWIKESPSSEYFGGENSSSEVETRLVTEIIEEFSPDVILTFHAPYKVVNYDGPAEELAKNISAIIGYPTSCDIGYPTPGSFGTYAGIERNIPTITLELDEEIDINELVSPVNKIFDYLANY